MQLARKLDKSVVTNRTSRQWRQNGTNKVPSAPMANTSNSTNGIGTPHQHWRKWLSSLVPSNIAIGYYWCHLNGDNGAIKWRDHAQDHHIQKKGLQWRHLHQW